MRTLPTLLLSLSLAALAFVAGRGCQVVERESQRWATVFSRTNSIVLLHILAEPSQVRKPSP
jgi:hypothetical protein